MNKKEKLRPTYELLLISQRQLIDAIQNKLRLGIGDMDYWENVLNYCHKTFPDELKEAIEGIHK